MNPAKLHHDLNNAIFELASKGIFSIANNHVLRRLSTNEYALRYYEVPDKPSYPSCDFSVLEEYFFYLKYNDYSIIMNDGSLVQFSYVLDSDGIAKHRLNYFHSAVALDIGEIDFEFSTVEDEIKRRLDDDALASVRPHTAIRFDYDRGKFSPGHAACHVTLISRHCRVPVTRPVSPGRFMEFICENFHPEIAEVVGQHFQPLCFDTNRDIAENFAHRIQVDVPEMPAA